MGTGAREGMRELVAGADGCRGGWVVAVTGPGGGSSVEFSGWLSFGALWAEARRREMLAVGVDMPVGLPGSERRTADIEARRLLGPRRSSLFWTPPRCVLDATDYAEANRRSRQRTARGLSAQSFALMPKVREVRDALEPKVFAPESRPRAAEVHPETSFAVLAGRPMSASKKQRAGIDERLEALSDDFPDIGEAIAGASWPGPPRPALDDLLDAAAAAWTARRLAVGAALCLGEGETDETGYPMNIWA